MYTAQLVNLLPTLALLGMALTGVESVPVSRSASRQERSLSGTPISAPIRRIGNTDTLRRAPSLTRPLADVITTSTWPLVTASRPKSPRSDRTRSSDEVPTGPSAESEDPPLLLPAPRPHRPHRPSRLLLLRLHLHRPQARTSPPRLLLLPPLLRPRPRLPHQPRLLPPSPHLLPHQPLPPLLLAMAAGPTPATSTVSLGPTVTGLARDSLTTLVTTLAQGLRGTTPGLLTRSYVARSNAC